MTKNIATPFASDSLQDDKPVWYRPHRKGTQASAPFAPDEDIEVWLKHNAPTTFQQLADIRYCLYHHCSRAEFTIANIVDDEFDLTGRHGTLRIVSNNARHYLLWRLRLLGKSKSWIGAIPHTKKPRRKEIM